MEYLSGQNLFEFLKQVMLQDNKAGYDERYIRSLMEQALKAVKSIHDIGICHRDIKLDNFVFVDADFNHIKLLDFGLSSVFRIDAGSDNVSKLARMKTYAGTLLYVAPEVIERQYD